MPEDVVVAVVDVTVLVGVTGAVALGPQGTILVVVIVSNEPVPSSVGIRVVIVTVHLVLLVDLRVVVLGVLLTTTRLASSTYTSLCSIAKYGCERVHTDTMLLSATASTLNCEKWSKLS